MLILAKYYLAFLWILTYEMGVV